jgi:hypothetical protein
MIFLFFPSMRILASVFVSATISIGLNKIFRFPLGAILSLIFEDMRLSSKILPVVSIHASISSMRCITIRTPDGLEMKHVKVSPSFVWARSKFVEKINSDLLFRMSKGTHVTIVAGFYS